MINGYKNPPCVPPFFKGGVSSNKIVILIKHLLEELFVIQ